MLKINKPNVDRSETSGSILISFVKIASTFLKTLQIFSAFYAYSCSLLSEKILTIYTVSRYLSWNL